MRVLIAPDCYGDSLTAVEAAEAIARGWRRGRPDDELTLAPQSDGGAGFVGVLAGRVGEVKTLRVSGPLTDEVSADWVLDPAPPRTAYIECARLVAWHCWAVRRPCRPRWPHTAGEWDS